MYLFTQQLKLHEFRARIEKTINRLDRAIVILVDADLKLSRLMVTRPTYLNSLLVFT